MYDHSVHVHVCYLFITPHPLYPPQSDTESHLTTKLCCFQLLEVLYSRLPGGALTSPGGSINNAYCKGSAKSGKELTQAITK